MVKYLVGRRMDPLLAVATGVFAYYIYETDPRNRAARPAERSLLDLIRRRYYGQPPPFALYSGPDPLGTRVDRTTARQV